MQKRNKLTVLTNPKLSEAASIIEKAFVQRRTLIVAGKCHVRYTGRAKSTGNPQEAFFTFKQKLTQSRFTQSGRNREKA